MTITDAGIKAAIKRAQATRKSVTIKDTGPRGAGRLAFIVRQRGECTTSEWYAVFHRGGAIVRAKIGSFPVMSLKDARRKFADEYAPAIAAGKDPRTDARTKEGAGTVSQLFQAYVDHMKEAGKKSWGEYERGLLKAKKSQSAAKALGKDKRACDVTPGEVSAFLARVHKRGSKSHADHLRAYMHAAFEWGLRAGNDYTRKQGDDAVRWCLTVNPVSAVPKDSGATKPGRRHLSAKEYRDFWNWLAARTCHSSKVLQLQMATGQRVQALAGLAKGQYDAGEKLLIWEADEMKNERAHVLPLPDAAAAVMDGLTADECGLYFRQPHKDKPVTHWTVADLCREYVTETGVERFTPRDVRRTWKTLTGLAGITKDIRDKLQNHAGKDVSDKHYDMYEYLREKREAIAVWSAWMDGILSGAVANKQQMDMAA